MRKWRSRFLAARLDGLGNEPRPGVPRTITDAQAEEAVVRTLEEVPEGATHWSERELARRVGISPTSFPPCRRPARKFGGFRRARGPYLRQLGYETSRLSRVPLLRSQMSYRYPLPGRPRS